MKTEHDIKNAGLPETIVVKQDGQTVEATTVSYVNEKTRWLRDFGYPNVTEDEVMAGVKKVLSKEPVTSVEDLFAMFIQKDLIVS